MSLTIIVGTFVAKFSCNYMRGNRRYITFFLYLSATALSVLLVVSSDYLPVFFVGLLATKYCMTRLISLKHNWSAARSSGRLFFRSFLLGIFMIAASLSVIAFDAESLSIQAILLHNSESNTHMIPLLCLVLGTFSMTGLIPFHKWLVSSLNAPTPVSALMHAGVINIGGYILARFSPLLEDNTLIFYVLFLFGLVSALVGTYWKLIQTDVKKMLACSTLAQMGFMVAQCGLGLFPAAISHMVLHGMFKSFLFFSSGNAAKEKSVSHEKTVKWLGVLWSVFCGVLGSYIFSYVTKTSWYPNSSVFVLTLVVGIGCAQIALTLCHLKSFFYLPVSLLASGFYGCIYGLNMEIMEHILPSFMYRPQPINFMYILGAVLLFFSWFGYQFYYFIKVPPRIKRLRDWFYVKMLNASQPHKETITANRNSYCH